MEKLDVEKEGIMEQVEIQQGQDDLEDSNVEDECQGRELFQKDMEIVLRLLPAKVWVNLTDMLLADHCTADLNNLCNSSPFFRDLMLSKRVLFLFPEILRIVGPQLQNEDRPCRNQTSSILTCRLLCKSWNKSVDHYISASARPDFFRAPPPHPKDTALTTARYEYFGFMAPQRLDKFLEYFDRSHHHSDSGGLQRNPFIGTTVALCTDLFVRENINPFYQQVVTLLEKYGKFIRVLSLGVPPPHTPQFHDFCWLLKSLEFCPNLTHLKVRQRNVHQELMANEKIEMESDFGEQAYRTVGSRGYIRRRIFNEMAHLPAAVQDEIFQNALNILEFFQQTKTKDYFIDEYLDWSTRTMGHYEESRFNQELQGQVHRRLPLPEVTSCSVDEMSESKFRTQTHGYPMPNVRQLECLKLIKLPVGMFNPLIQSYWHVTWLHIEPLKSQMSCYADWWKIDFPNLRKLYIKFPGGPEEVRRLGRAHQSFLKLTSLHFDYPAEEEYMGWMEIFQILKRNWAGTLVELKMRLPVPKTAKETDDVRRARRRGDLNFPKLKRLTVWKSLSWDNEWAVRDFKLWDPIRANLEEFGVL